MFEGKNKQEIIKAAQNGNEAAIEYLIENHMYIVHYKAKSFFIKGQDHDDVIQEGRIGLYKAIRDYKLAGNASFINFCNMCIYRQLITAIKTADRDKHFYFNQSTSLDKSLDYINDSERNLNDVLADDVKNTEEEVLSEELFSCLFEELKDILTELELGVFKLYLNDKSYQKIAERLAMNTKCVDNALQRIRKKTKEIKSDYEIEDFID